jgi:membrane protease YdiL (CAAX protease family)
MAFFTSIHAKDDPLNVWMKTAAPVAVLILVPLLILLQQFKTSLHEEGTSSPPAELIANEDADDPGVGRLVVESKAVVKFVYFELSEKDSSGKAAQKPFGDPEHPEKMEGKAHFSRDHANKAIKELSDYAVTRTDRFRVAIVAGELLGPQAAHDRLEALKGEAEAGGALAADIGWLSPWYLKWVKGTPPPLPDDVQQTLIARHGWFGKLAVSHQRASGDPLRWEVVSGAMPVLTFEIVMGLWRGVTFLLGLVLAIITFIKIRGFEPAMVETDVPRQVYAETFAIFILGFLILDAVDIFVIGETGAWSVFLGEAMLWSASAACLWPLLRGVSFEELRIDLGWTSGQGIGKEIGAGILGYLVGLPLHSLYGFIVGLIHAAAGGDSGGGDEGIKYPEFPTPLSGTWTIILISVMSASLWAPFFEETFFRGTLHRYLPSKLGIMGRVAITAVIFGSIHPYGPTGIIDVTLAGLIFGLLREWRGSLIAPIVAHFLHNTTLNIEEFVPVYLLN